MVRGHHVLGDRSAGHRRRTGVVHAHASGPARRAGHAIRDGARAGGDVHAAVRTRLGTARDPAIGYSRLFSSRLYISSNCFSSTGCESFQVADTQYVFPLLLTTCVVRLRTPVSEPPL